ncbi:glycoside hydrolase family 15 protein [Kushneria aurantia]|uniref:Glycoside hydrolase family 15 protein n=1 Tax=Kushneria aurantia TaxID=504092 RepID=A0ABV6G1E2_9GAMM|nr:glycoside hydrolase family 15 protein [Kushneria aurantia]
MSLRHMDNPVRCDGFAPLEDYAAIGEGRSVALVALDGAIDWWCAPSMDKAPLFDRLLEPEVGGYFALTPCAEEYRVERCYRDNSNVLETEFITDSGRVRVTESINSNNAGRLPWCELARRVEGLEGEVEMSVSFRAGTHTETASPWLQKTPIGEVFNIGDLKVMLRFSDDVRVDTCGDRGAEARLTTHRGSRSMVALLAAEGEPLAVPSVARIDRHIEISDVAWRSWVEGLAFDGQYVEHVHRSALALKFLLYSPSGALAAAATTSLPERIGGDKNYDYRYAWVRDACLMIKAFVHAGAIEESQAAFSWLVRTIRRHGPDMQVCYTLQGDLIPAEQYPPLAGYRGSQPVRVGNNARGQLQLGMFGDMLATASLFIDAGHIVDITTARLLCDLANQCADRWRFRDSGIWELPGDVQHYTHSKMACWQALTHAIKLADQGYLEPTWRARWSRERERIETWVNAHCWCESRGAYVMHPQTQGLDAALCLMHRFGAENNRERMRSTYDAIRAELGRDGALLYRYSGSEEEEGAFVACSFWMVEALAALGDKQVAENLMDRALKACNGNLGLLTEMVDPGTGAHLGNVPQGLSHLALICAANALSGGLLEDNCY